MSSDVHPLVQVAIAHLRPSLEGVEARRLALAEPGERELSAALSELKARDSEGLVAALVDLELFALYLRAELDSAGAADQLQALLGAYPEMQTARKDLAASKQEHSGAKFARFLGPEGGEDPTPDDAEAPIPAKDFLRKLIK